MELTFLIKSLGRDLKDSLFPFRSFTSIKLGDKKLLLPPPQPYLNLLLSIKFVYHLRRKQLLRKLVLQMFVNSVLFKSRGNDISIENYPPQLIFRVLKTSRPAKSKFYETLAGPAAPSQCEGECPTDGHPALAYLIPNPQPQSNDWKF